MNKYLSLNFKKFWMSSLNFEKFLIFLLNIFFFHIYTFVLFIKSQYFFIKKSWLLLLFKFHNFVYITLTCDLLYLFMLSIFPSKLAQNYLIGLFLYIGKIKFYKNKLASQLFANLLEKCLIWVDCHNHILNLVIRCGFIKKICKQLFFMNKNFLFGWNKSKYKSLIKRLEIPKVIT